MTLVDKARGTTTSSEAVNGGVAGAITIVIVASLNQAGLDIDPAEASAFTVITSFIVGKWLT